MKYPKYHKEFVQFLKDNEIYQMYINQYNENNRLDTEKRRLRGTKTMKLSEFYTTQDPISWLNNCFLVGYSIYKCNWRR